MNTDRDSGYRASGDPEIRPEQFSLPAAVRGWGRNESTGRRLVGLGGALTFLAAIVPWVTVSFFANLNFGLFSNGGIAVLGFLYLVAGGGSIWAAAKLSPSRLKKLGIVLGGLFLAWSVIAIVGLTHAAAQTYGIAHLSTGPWLSFLGAGGMLGGGLVLAKTPVHFPTAER